MNDGQPALVVVDMQNYYLQKNSSYYRYFNRINPGCLDYIHERCEKTVIPAIVRLLKAFRKNKLSVVYLRLCSTRSDRGDLHRFFRETWLRGAEQGFEDIYPLADDHYAQVVNELTPLPGDTVIEKTTYSPFTSTSINEVLAGMKVTALVMTGLATSQCVETTARDGSDHGYEIIQVEDGQADYDELSHTSSLFSSQSVCGGLILSSDLFIKNYLDQR